MPDGDRKVWLASYHTVESFDEVRIFSSEKKAIEWAYRVARFRGYSCCGVDRTGDNVLVNFKPKGETWDEREELMWPYAKVRQMTIDG